MSSQRRKSRKAHFTAPSGLRRKLMSCHLNKDLKTKYEVRCIAVRKGDSVKIMRGTFKGREGKVQTVYRKKFCLHIEKITREKTNGTSYHLILFRIPSPNPNPCFQLLHHQLEAGQEQERDSRQKEEIIKVEELKVQGRYGRNRLIPLKLNPNLFKEI